MRALCYRFKQMLFEVDNWAKGTVMYFKGGRFFFLLSLLIILVILLGVHLNYG